MRRDHVHRRRCGLVAAVAAAVLSTAACGTAEAEALSVDELLDQRPQGEVEVRGGIVAEGLEYFGPEGEAGWEYDVELCQSVEVTGEGQDAEATCEGASVALPSSLVEQDLPWRFGSFGTQYMAPTTVTGRLDDDTFLVTRVGQVEVGGTTDTTDSTTDSTTDTTVASTGSTASTVPTTGTTFSEPLPIEELPGEDLRGLRLHVRATEVIYLPTDGFVERVRQLRANCESLERLQQILDNMSRRGPATPQDFVTQQGYVCPELVAQLEVIDGVTLPEG